MLSLTMKNITGYLIVIDSRNINNLKNLTNLGIGRVLLYMVSIRETCLSFDRNGNGELFNGGNNETKTVEVVERNVYLTSFTMASIDGNTIGKVFEIVITEIRTIEPIKAEMVRKQSERKTVEFFTV